MTYFFYDLETTGLQPREARIMQFAGQRTSATFEPIGEPVNVLIKLTPDVLPEPDAIMVTGITPQDTLADGMTEAAFLAFFYREVVKSDTVYVGYNSIRFDDEFMRYLHFRNYYDPYEWHWSDRCSRWDLLDVVRMTRALRPDGIVWPTNADGTPTNRLELLTAANGLSHTKAHDALNDVEALIMVAKLLHDTHPELYDYLLENRHKKAVQRLLDSQKLYTYVTSAYPSEQLHASIVCSVVPVNDRADGAVVYDLRVDPTPYIAMSVTELVATLGSSSGEEKVRTPFQTVKYNQCPAIVPGVVQDEKSLTRLSLPLPDITRHYALLQNDQTGFRERLRTAQSQYDRQRQQRVSEPLTMLTVDSRLYDGFCGDGDKSLCRALRAAAPQDITVIGQSFEDERLRLLLLLYKARNYPADLTDEERAQWHQYLRQKLIGDHPQSGPMSRYFARLAALAKTKNLSQQKAYLLEELELYGQSILPVDEDG